MTEKFSRSFQLVKDSFQVLRKDKEIMVFSLIGFLLVILAGFLIFNAFDVFTFLKHSRKGDSPPLNVWLAFFVLYFSIVFIFVFCKTGITITAYRRLSGSNPTFIATVGEIGRHFYKIFIWALFAATIGVVLQILKEKGNWIARLFGFVFSIAWNLVAFLALPAVVIGNLNAWQAITKSEEIFKKTWGENIIGTFSINIFFYSIFVALLFFTFMTSPTLLVCACIFPIMSNIARATIPFTVIGGFILLLFNGVLWVSIQSIYATAVYYYAVTEDVPPYFSADAISSGFVPKEA